MVGTEVVTSDDHKLGQVVAEGNDCVIVETGHVFKKKHAIPSTFVHEHDGVLRATVAKEIITDSPKIDDETNWDCDAVLLHYGLNGPFEVDPPADGLEHAETEGARAGIEPAPAQRMRAIDESDKPGYDKPAVRERQANANDPAGTSANLTTKN